MKDLLRYAEYAMVLVPILLLIGSLPFFRYLIRIKDFVRDLEQLKQEVADNIVELHKEHEKFKTECRQKFREAEKTTKEMEANFRHESRAFTDTLNKINITLGKMEQTLVGINQVNSKNEAHLEQMLTRVYKDLDTLREETRDELRDIKDRIE